MSERRIKAHVAPATANVTGGCGIYPVVLGSDSNQIGASTLWDDGDTTWDDGNTTWDPRKYPSAVAAISDIPFISASTACYVTASATARAGTHADAVAGVQCLLEINVPLVRYYTTKLYPVNIDEAAEGAAVVAAASAMRSLSDDAESTGAFVAGGELRALMQQYDWPAEAGESTGAGLLGGELRTLLITYADWPAEAGESIGADVIGGELRTLLITYDNWPAEAAESTGSVVVGGELA